jgi:hypothetical protein
MNFDLKKAVKFSDRQPTGDFYLLRELINGNIEWQFYTAGEYSAHVAKYSPLTLFEWVAA